jgi:hypothetical protein
MDPPSLRSDKPLIDRLLINGRILTMDPAQPEVESLATKDSRIVFAGSNQAAEHLAGVAGEVVDLRGRTVLPGFIDAHIHFLEYGLSLAQLDLTGARSIEEMVQKIAEKASGTRAGMWLRCWGYDDNKLAERRHPTRWDLDKATENHPVLLKHVSGHMSVLNSKAIELAGISRDTPDPQGGRVDRNPDTGEPSGLLLETAQDLIQAALPKYSLDEMCEGLRLASEKAAQYGITSIHDPGIDAEQFKAYQRALESGHLKTRAYLMIKHESLPSFESTNVVTGLGDEWLRIGPVKIFADGSLIGRTAAMFEPFENEPGNAGMPTWTQEQLDAAVEEAHSKGFQLAVHAIGDRGISMVLDAFGKALKKIPRRDHRHRIEHCGVLNAQLMGRIAEMNVIVATQPRFIVELGEGFERALGERISLTYPFKSLIGSRVRVAGSSDCPVVPCPPLWNIYAAVTRKTEIGRVLVQAERVTPEEAIKMFTVEAAYASFEEDMKGSLSVGKLADYVILSGNPLSTDPDRIKDLRVLATVVGGKVVYEDREFMGDRAIS